MNAYGPYRVPALADEVAVWSSRFAGAWRVSGRTMVVDRANDRVLERLDLAMINAPVRAVLWLDVSDRAVPGDARGATYRQRVLPVAPAGQVSAPPADHTASITFSLIALGALATIAYLSRPDSPAERAARMRRIAHQYPAG